MPNTPGFLGRKPGVFGLASNGYLADHAVAGFHFDGFDEIEGD
jgi:hypothetical protein